MRRLAEEILADYDAGCQGLADIDMRGILWEAMEDIRSSYRLAMEAVGINPERIDEIQDTVRDYMVNHYGDD